MAQLVKRPVIGVTGPDKGGLAAWFFTSWGVRMAGGKPVRITPKKKRSIKKLSGLIIGGGADIEPKWYGAEEETIFDTEDPKSSTWRDRLEYILSLFIFPLTWLIRKIMSTKDASVDVQRDEMEFTLLKGALERKIPIMGICRGMQLINVHFKGTLYQDITEFYGETPRITTLLPKKRIFIEESSCLYKVWDKKECKVNGLHNQAIENEGEGIRIIAREANDVVQAIQHKDHDFVLGVQWHPEYMPQKSDQRKLFRHLIKSAKGSNENKAESR